MSHPPSGLPRSRLILAAVMGALALGAVLAAIAVGVGLHVSARQGAEREARRLAVVLAEQTSRELQAIDLVLDRLEQELRAPSPADQVAPVLVLPRVLEPDLCRELIDYYGRGEPTASGFAIEVEGQTVTRLNATLKRRTDVTIEDPALIEAVRCRLEMRLFPMVERAFGWRPTRIERYLICCYAGDAQGFFFPHRDDATAGNGCPLPGKPRPLSTASFQA